MPMSFKTGAVQPVKPKVDPAIKKAEREAKSNRRKSKDYDDSAIYGSNLFEPVAKKERDIVIKFKSEFTNEGLHFTIDGKFAYKLTFEAMDYDHEDLFMLYYFSSPILDPQKDFVLKMNEKVTIFESLSCSKMEEKLIFLYKEEFKKEKEELLKELEKQERLEKDERDMNEKLEEMATSPIIEIVEKVVEEKKEPRIIGVGFKKF